MVATINIGYNIMASCFPHGFLISLPTTSSNSSSNSSNSSEKRYSAFEVRKRIVEKLGGYRNVKKLYKIKGILKALKFAREKGLRESELEQLLKQAEELQKNDH